MTRSQLDRRAKQANVKTWDDALLRWPHTEAVIEALLTLTLFPTAYFFRGSHGGVESPPYGKSTYECLSPILFCTVKYTYIRSSVPKEYFPNFKTLDLVADQSSATNST
jgi:hypothetical protein